MNNLPDRLSDPEITSETYETLPKIASMSNNYENEDDDNVILYDDHCDIMKVHAMVRSRFSDLHSKFPEWNIELGNLNRRLEVSVSAIDKRESDKRIRIVRRLLSMISKENGYPLWREYLSRSKDILLEYKERCESDDTHDLVYRYNNVIRDYCDIKIIRRINHDYTLCPKCDGPRVHHGGNIICQECGIQDQLISKESYQGTGRKSAYVHKSDYVSKENFLKGLQRYQGKRSRKLPVDMFNKMDAYVSKFSLPKSDEVKKMNARSDGKRGPREFTRRYMKGLLDELGYEAYYNDINLITHLYWGWSLPNLSNYEEQIKKDYDMAQNVFNDIPKDRQSSLVMPYQLYRHLRRVGYPCSIEDFDIVTTPEIRQSYESIWKEICKRLDWEFEPI